MKSFCTFAIFGFFLSSCATTGPVGFSSLPLSSHETPIEPIGGSGIAFQAFSEKCADSLVLTRQLKLADEAYGIAANISIDTGIEKRFKAVQARNLDGNGEVLNAIDLAPGEYVVSGISCIMVGYPVFRRLETTPDTQVIYGTFSVEPGKTTYIGRITVEADADGQFDFSVLDQSQKAMSEYANRFPERSELTIGVMGVSHQPASLMQSIKTHS